MDTFFALPCYNGVKLAANFDTFDRKKKRAYGRLYSGIEKDSFSKKSKVVFEQGRFEHHSGRALNIDLIIFHVQPNL